MTPTALKPASSWLLAAGLLTLLLILASLQYRWLDEVSRADRDKSRDLLQAAVSRFAEDFDRELTRAFLYFQPYAGSRDLQGFAEKYQRWQTYAPFPELVRDLYLARRGAGGALEAGRFDPDDGAFVPAPWPAELEQLHRRLVAERRRPRRGEPPGRPAGHQILADEVPALILPMFGGGPGGGFPGGGPGGPHRPGDGRPGGPPPPGGRGLVIVLLDLDIIRDVILPQLSERHLNGGDGTEYRARVVALDDRRIIFRRGAPPEGGQRGDRESDDGDADAGLFGLLPPEKLGTLELEAGLERSPEPAGRPRGRRPREGIHYRRLYRYISTAVAPSAPLRGDAASTPLRDGRWRLVASHPAGSLDAAVARAHHRNLAISFGILLLLGASLLLMLLSTRRLQAVARQQLEFVASVTHELLTPLAAVRSAGQNLADGVVAEPAQVRRYGRLVEDEGRRLSTMVEQVLEFAGMQAGRRTYVLERTELAPVIDGALAEYSGVLDEKGLRVEKRLDDDLPEIMADAAALRRAVQNLIANAVKYGAQGSWIGLSAVAGEGPTGTELRLSVEDRGPGIAAADLPRLFEPFYRGKNGSTEAIPGSGLGLSLVKHIVEGHGGRVAVDTQEGEGSTFTLHLPAAAGVARGRTDEL